MKCTHEVGSGALQGIGALAAVHRPWLIALLWLAACASGSSGDTGAGVDAASGSTAGSGAPPAPTAGAFANPTAMPGAAGAASVEPMGCNDLSVQFQPVIPTVLLLIDRSGSMWDQGYGASPTRWQAIYDSLMQPGTGVVQPFEHDVRFGLMTYTGDAAAQTCPAVSSVAPALGNYEAMRQRYDEQSARPAFKADTPTGQGVRAATELLASVPEDGEKVIILITDGEPDTCATPDPQCGQDESIAAVQAAFAQGISTFVIGISSDIGLQHLQDVANAGAGLPVGAPDMQFIYNCINPGYATLSAEYAGAGATPGQAPVYQPEDGDAIAATLHAVIRGVQSCSYQLNGEVDLDKAGLGTVLLDGAPVVHEDAHGWRMQDSRTLELLGDACTKLQTAASELLISFPCDVVDVF